MTTPTHKNSSPVFLSMTPWSMAAPTAAQISAWLTIQPMPKRALKVKVIFCCEAIQIR